MRLLRPPWTGDCDPDLEPAMTDDEKLSAFLDGEWVPDDAFLERLERDGELGAQWALWHQVSDALNGHPGSEFDHAAFRRRLAGEPTVLAPQVRPARPWRRRAGSPGWGLSLAAGLAALLLVGSLALPRLTGEDGARMAASATPPVTDLPAAKTGLDDYLLAHQPLSGSVLVGGTQAVQAVSVPLPAGAAR
jgi:anti-sigma factor RsiW